MKAYVIVMSDNEKSLAGVETLKQSIESTSTDLDLEIIEAVQPDTMGNANFNLFGRTVPWTWSTSPESDAIDLHTGLYKRHYKAVDQKRVESCALSHFTAWMKCFGDNKPCVILEHDALFIKKFDPSKYVHKKWGVIGLNDPRGNTRKGAAFHRQVEAQGKGIHDIPIIDSSQELPLPMGIAGNSAYAIKPHAAKKLLEKVEEIGMWPNDALMCRQLFPGLLKVVNPYYTTTQGTQSTTTAL